MRIGIDVGGTNTDAVLMDGETVVAAYKTPTTENVESGVISALREVLGRSGTDPASIVAVMIGTTHFTNAVVERKRLRAACGASPSPPCSRPSRRRWRSARPKSCAPSFPTSR